MSWPEKSLETKLAEIDRDARELGAAVGRVMTSVGSRGPLPGETAERAAARLSRSGTRLTEAQRSETCERPEALKVRLRPGYRARLRALSEDDGYSVAEWIETWVEMAESEIASVRERPAKRPKK
jgi:hypothetical protein